MGASARPKVTAGLPVFNGGAFLAQALDALLAQDFESFEVVISDNGSTDTTHAIGQAYAARDPRVRYVRYDTNRGASWNFNNVAQLAAGEYFMWCAHDDLWAPDCLSRYAAALDADPDAVLVYCRAQPIGSRGQAIGERYSEFANDDPDVRVRWRRLLEHWILHAAIYGMIRTEALRRTRPIATSAACEIIFMAELAVLGRTIELVDTFAWKRVMDAGVPYRTRQEQIVYLDPARPDLSSARFMRWRVIRECIKGLRHLGADRASALTRDALMIYATQYLSQDVKEEVAAVIGRGKR